MQIKILTPGRVKTGFIREGLAHYQKRLRHYCTLNWVEIREESVLSGKKSPEALIKEGKRFLEHLKGREILVVLDPRGRKVSSEGLAQTLSRFALKGQSSLTFIVGGPDGLWEDLMERADLRLSLSPLTFPHELALLILMEQLYRAFTLIKGEPYHRG